MKCYTSKIDVLLSQLELYSDQDADKFEATRKELLQTAIDSYPDEYRKRAQGIQFELDCELRKYKNPVARMNRMVELFWEKFEEFNLVINEPTSVCAAREKASTPAKVIALSASGRIVGTIEKRRQSNHPDF